jgi:hypothetical protein
MEVLLEAGADPSLETTCGENITAMVQTNGPTEPLRVLDRFERLSDLLLNNTAEDSLELTSKFSVGKMVCRR